MKGIMQYEPPQPDLTVWEKTFLPTTSSRIKHLLNGKYRATSFASKPSEDGDMECQGMSLFVPHPDLTESSSSQSEESWNSWQDIRTSSSETLCPYSISVLMGRPRSIALTSEEITDESTFDEWPQTRSTSDTSLRRMVFGSLLRIISWSVSAIRRTGN